MIGLEINDAVIVEQKQILEQALSTNPKTQKALQKLIRKVILEARAKIVGNIKFDNGDPRHAARAVRTVVYKQILGGNVNIYNSRKAHGSNSYEPPRVLQEGQRGGNRRPRSKRTQNIMSYDSLDRGFILRWVDEGTQRRAIERLVEIKRADGTSKFRWRADASVYGNRGSIRGRDFFRKNANPAIVLAADHLSNMIDEELETILNQTK